MLCPQIRVHTSHSSQQEEQAHIWENILDFEGIQELIKQQRQKQNRDKDACTGLRKERSEWTAPDLSDQSVQSCLNSQDKASVLKGFCSVNDQGNLYWTVRETMNKITRSMSAEEIWRSWPYNHSVLILKKNPFLPLKWSDSTYKSGHSQLIQAEEGIISPVARKAKDGICIMKVRIGVAALRNNITPDFQSRQMHWLFAE